jgi:predicted component of type VI protein secretion system
MSIEDLKKAVAGLPPDQYTQFRAWFEAFEADRFDRKIERDAQAGKLDQFANEAQQWHSLANSKNPLKARTERDPAFREALLTEVVEQFLAGDVETDKAVLRSSYKPPTASPARRACRRR